MPRAVSHTFTHTPKSSFLEHLLSIAIFRSWRLLTFFGVWSTAVCLISHNVHDLALQPTLLTVLGTVLGFVVSFRTTISYDRYNEGRKLWSQIIFATRMFARMVWFHVPEDSTGFRPDDKESADERKVRTLVEKKAVINLLEAFATSTKHYLRGEHGIRYKDVHPFVSFLPSYYDLPASIPPREDEEEGTSRHADDANMDQGSRDNGAPLRRHSKRHSEAATSSFVPTTVSSRAHTLIDAQFVGDQAGSKEEDLLPAEMRPDLSVRARCFQFMEWLTGGKHACKPHTVCHADNRVHNVPLEISFYLSSYIAALENRNDWIRPRIDPPAMSQLHATLGELVDALTGLERILTTPVMYAYSTHLWLLTAIYCLLLPFQILSTLGWFTIPATVLATFMFFGFLLAGKELERYDKNDLDLEHYVHNIIHKELHAITSMPTPSPSAWAFDARNNSLFPGCPHGHGHGHGNEHWHEQRVAPEEWVSRGHERMRDALAEHVYKCGE
ncbi:Bestrophin, RFP-TM, chloride channel-domain-containing protein [Phlebopus sp. FC_14]|nr:Bestrophin, RFP-TM, chloride channel-domain-containing protein [Phlebopus sp. FC_14]